LKIAVYSNISLSPPLLSQFFPHREIEIERERKREEKRKERREEKREMCKSSKTQSVFFDR
jgi:hypothetical protein